MQRLVTLIKILKFNDWELRNIVIHKTQFRKSVSLMVQWRMPMKTFQIDLAYITCDNLNNVMFLCYNILLHPFTPIVFRKNPLKDSSPTLQASIRLVNITILQHCFCQIILQKSLNITFIGPEDKLYFMICYLPDMPVCVIPKLTWSTSTTTTICFYK